MTSACVPPGEAEARGPQNAPFLSPETPPPPLPLGTPGTPPHDPHLERVLPCPPAARLFSPCACALGSACTVGRRCRRPECPPGRKMAAGSRGGPRGAEPRGCGSRGAPGSSRVGCLSPPQSPAYSARLALPGPCALLPGLPQPCGPPGG